METFLKWAMFISAGLLLASILSDVDKVKDIDKLSEKDWCIEHHSDTQVNHLPAKCLKHFSYPQEVKGI